MLKKVDQYVRNCHSCQHLRTSRHPTFGVLRHLPIQVKPWEDISMDFVVGSPECEGFDAVWVVLDRLSKMRNFIPCHTTVDAVGLANLFLQEVVRYHGLPRTIVSDRVPQSESTFWGPICNRFGIYRRMSTAFHLQTDGHSERMNAGMKQCLRVFVNHQKHYWVQWLALAEFAANNGVSKSTKGTPFFSVQGGDAQMLFVGKPTIEQDQRCLKTEQVHARLQQVHDHVRVEMRRIQAPQKEGANRGRVPSPNIQVRYKVWVDPRNVRTTRSTR